jgi:hypothetical protein
VRPVGQHGDHHRRDQQIVDQLQVDVGPDLAVVDAFPEYGKHRRLTWRNQTIAKCLI